MFAPGCIQALQCNKNTCPTGITIHDKKLQMGLNPTDKATRVASYARHTMRELGAIARSCSLSGPRQLNRSQARVVIEPGYSETLGILYRNREQPVRII